MSEQYETVWTGATWRAFPQPAIAPQRVRTGLRVDERMQRYSSRELVLACVATCYGSVAAVSHRTGLSDRRVRQILRSAYEDGLLERVQNVPKKSWYRPEFLYRQKREAAA